MIEQRIPAYKTSSRHFQSRIQNNEYKSVQSHTKPDT